MTTCYLYSFGCPLSNVYYSFYFRIVSNWQTERFHLDIWSVLQTFCSLVYHVYRLICKLEQINRAILVLLTLIGQLLRKIRALMILNSCPEVVRYTKADTMYRQFPGLITKVKQKRKKQNNWSHDPRVVCVVSPQKPPYFTILLWLLFQFHLSIIWTLNMTFGCNARQSRQSRS